MTSSEDDEILRVNNLKTYYHTEDGNVHAVDDVSFHLEQGETLGLVGESGCGKTTLIQSLTRLLPDNGHVREGDIHYKGRNLVDLSDKEFREQIRWKEISIIPQSSMNAFDPVYSVGKQIVQTIRYHNSSISKEEAWEQAKDLFEKLGLEVDRVYDYPHQFSGGMSQRAMIALAICLEPSLLLADEPTTALDVVIQDSILEMIKELQIDVNAAMILVTHDMSVVSETCDRIAVMYGGRIVELGDTESIINNPRHPYTLGLRNAFPDITADDQELISIPGTPPDILDPDEGCRFEPRCPFAVEECATTTPERTKLSGNHFAECHRVDEKEHLQTESAQKETWNPTYTGNN